MAQEPEQGRNASGIARAGKRKWGYDPSQVDAFLERAHALYDSDDAQLSQQDIQNVSFDLRKNGYVIAQVDAALARLERAVVDKQTTREIRQNGRVAWKAQTEALYREISTHASRAAKERFRSGAKKAPSYDRKQVDRLVDQIVDKAAAELGLDGVTEDDVRKLVNLNSNSVANVIFTQRKGKHGYDERQVDNYLNACVRLLSRLESYARVADYVNDDGGQRNAASASAAGAPTVASLFPDTQASAAATSAMPQSYAPSSSSSSDFDALSKAEQAIFTAPADAAATSVASTPSPVQSTPEPSVTPAQTAAQSMPPSFAPEPTSSASGAGNGSASTADEPSATETASWTPDFASMPPISTPAPTAASAQSSAQPASTAAYTSPFSAPSTDAASTAAPASYTPSASSTPSSYTPPSYTPSSSTTSYAPADSSTASTSSYTPSAFSTASDTPSSFEAPSYTPSSSTSSYTPSTSSASSWTPTTTTPAGTSAGSSSFVVDSMENANGSASLAALAHGSDSAASSTGTGDASASSALKVDSPTVPSLGPIDIPDLSFPSFDFDTSTTTRKHDE